MNKRSRLSLLSVGCIVVILGCSINNIEISEKPNYELTITAQAQVLQNGAQQQASAQAPAVVNPPAAAVVNSATPGPAPAANVSVTPTTVTVKVSVETNCRQGPSVNFPSVYSMSVSDVAEVIGKNTFTNYWIIKIPGSNSTCWLWGQYATVSGNTANLIEFATPTPKVATATITSSPVPAITKPNAPSNLSEQNTCTLNPNGGFKYITAGTVTWQDNSNNEKGFNIYWKNGFASGAVDILIGTVGPNTTSYGFDNQQTYSDMVNSVKVEAFNDAGLSDRASVNIVLTCPP